MKNFIVQHRRVFDLTNNESKIHPQCLNGNLSCLNPVIAKVLTYLTKFKAVLYFLKSFQLFHLDVSAS
jgi:hypothetical protein